MIKHQLRRKAHVQLRGQVTAEEALGRGQPFLAGAGLAPGGSVK